MSDITWGPEILVGGVKPAWLGDDDKWQWRINSRDDWQDGIEPFRYEQVGTFKCISEVRLPADHPHYYSADTVQIARMTKAEADAWAEEFTTHFSPSYAAIIVAAMGELGLIREETLAERFTRETGHAITPAIEAALAFDR